MWRFDFGKRLCCVRQIRVFVASINISHNFNTNNWFILHLSPSSSTATLAAGMFTALGMGIGLCARWSNFVELKRSRLESRASHSFENVSCNSCLKSPLALYTEVDDGCPSCNMLPVLHGNTRSLSLS